LAKYSLLKPFSSQNLTGDMTEAHKGPATEGPKRLSFKDRLSAFSHGAILGLVFGSIGIFFEDHPLRDIAFAPLFSLIIGAFGFLGGPRLLEILSVLHWS
jgi:hypothetical protein